MNADVGDTKPLEGDEKLPNVMGLQSPSVQEPSLEKDALDDDFATFSSSSFGKRRVVLGGLGQHQIPQSIKLGT